MGTNMIVLLCVLIALCIVNLALLWYISDEIVSISVETNIIWQRQTDYLAYFCAKEYVDGNTHPMKSIFPYMIEKEENDVHAADTGNEP